MSENRFAVFEDLGESYDQLSVWMPKDKAEKFGQETFLNRDKVIFERHEIPEK